MEYCSGGDLGHLLKKAKGGIREEKIRPIICEIILAIRELHIRNIIFRDLKPDNVLIDREGHIKVTDFGLSKILRKDNYELSNSFCGSTAYMTPEMLQKKPHGKSIDWYGVGALLYECLVTVPPYYDEDQDKLYENITSAPLKLPTFLSEDC
mmetsp:Transcript_17564/g.27130  ORF Transcript_17564/g.27130 Transcript_17564/m.27130 type:complete len:152 (+) Transcript_17564:199-654(+)